MDRRPIVLLAMGFFLVLAGCSGMPFADSTTTPGGENGGTDTRTSAPAAISYPAGYGERGITDAEAATQAHVNGVSLYDSFTINYHATVTLPNRSTEVEFVQRVNVRERRAHLVSNISDGTSVTHYYANDTVYIRSESPRTNGTSYSSRSRELDVLTVSGREFVRPIVTNVSYGPPERTEHDGETMLRYEATGLDTAEGIVGEGVSVQNVTSFSAVLLVDGDGLVRYIEYEATVIRNGQERSVTVTIDVTDFDATTVKRPDWVDRASG